MKGIRLPPWNHNAWYHPFVERHLPPDPERILDLGCGRGSLARRLAAAPTRPTVDAVDREPAMLRAAQSGPPSPVRWIDADAVRHLAEHPDTYDAICSIAVLHHLPLAEALRTAGRSLRPGGRLVLIALPRTDLPRDLPLEALAGVAHRVVGAGLLVRRMIGRKHRHRLEAEQAADRDGAMPTADAPLTLREVRRVARQELPGVRVRRLLFWRYALLWQRPTA